MTKSRLTPSAFEIMMGVKPEMKAPIVKPNALILAVAAMCGSSWGYASDEALTATHELYQQRAEILHRNAEQLTDAIAKVCEAEEPDIVSNAQLAWRDLAGSWMFFQGRENLPLSIQDQVWHVQFWPDKKNLVGRQVPEWLTSDRPVSVTAVTEGSVAAQGLGAAEWLLFDKGSDWQTPRQCEYALAVAQGLEVNTQAVISGLASSEWQSVHGESVVEHQFVAINHQLARLLKKLGISLGSNGKGNLYFAEAWRSDHSLALIAASLASVDASWQASIRPALVAKGETDLVANMDILLRTTQENSVFSDENTYSTLLIDDYGYRQLVGLQTQLMALETMWQQEIAAALSISAGFNATDGD
uniref:imelysin family protein n=1 Tax=Thaumasiovibrio occultus TaxID=1891184 RepID=UPI000B356E0E|nr:imelysin family protein [Thaumasiovibrio occultus]